MAGTGSQTHTREEEPNPESKLFVDLLRSLDEELWPGCENHSVLSVVARLLNIKSKNHLSEKCLDSLLEVMKEMLPPNHKLLGSFCEIKELVQGLGLTVEKIDCCLQGCMLYWQEDSELSKCKFCGLSRYKQRKGSGKPKPIPYRSMFYFPLTPRLRRLYASKATAADMRWHHEHVCHNGMMCHPCDSEAWKHFNNTNMSFAAEPRNVRLGLYTDGFQWFGKSGQPYSCWPIIVTPYNLPPWMCMKEQFMFLTTLVPGTNNPKQKIDVFLQPLIVELRHLWENGFDTYDVSQKQNFKLRAALIWTISDFPTSSMLSGWSKVGKNACPYCMENSQAFPLPNGGKISWFDNHRKFLPADHPYRENKANFRANRVERTPPPPIKSSEQILNEIDESGLLKVTDFDYESVNKKICRGGCGWKKRSIFWDLPYWKTNLIRHNIDVMYVEKNVFANVFNTVMNIEGKTKDNAEAREDVNLFCNRPELARDHQSSKYPKACYALDLTQRKMLCEWVKELNFPDGYLSNLSRCVHGRKHTLVGMKTHDCHVFMQRLLPIALHELLPRQVWEAITELSVFFKNLTANVIEVDDMARLEEQIPIILCKLETIFPPGFFDLMEHLPVHLPYEAKTAGPVQYRWMDPFERYLKHLKKNVKNEARVEGSTICNAYLVEEASNFCSYYFEPQVYSRIRKVPHNDNGGDGDAKEASKLTIFSYNGRGYGHKKVRWLDEEEYEAAHTYILLNCPEVKPFVEIFMNHLRDLYPGVSNSAVMVEVKNKFASWFLNYGQNNLNENKCIRDMMYGPARGVKSFPIYFVNGYRFHATSHGGNRSTSNSAIRVIGDGFEYYGNIDEIIQIEYPGLPKRTVLFKCFWYDPTPNRGMRVHPRYNIVEVNTNQRFKEIGPFILASQATQVYYVPYPRFKRDKTDWLVACSIKAREILDKPNNNVVPNNEDEAFQEDNAQLISIEVSSSGYIHNLNDPSNELVDLSGYDSDQEEDFVFNTDSDDDVSEDEDLIEYDSD